MADKLPNIPLLFHLLHVFHLHNKLTHTGLSTRNNKFQICQLICFLSSTRFLRITVIVLYAMKPTCSWKFMQWFEQSIWAIVIPLSRAQSLVEVNTHWCGCFGWIAVATKCVTKSDLKPIYLITYNGRRSILT